MKSIPLKKIFLIFLPVLILVVFASCEFSFSIGGDDDEDDDADSKKSEDDEDKDATDEFLEKIVKGVIKEIAADKDDSIGKQETENPEGGKTFKRCTSWKRGSAKRRRNCFCSSFKNHRKISNYSET